MLIRVALVLSLVPLVGCKQRSEASQEKSLDFADGQAHDTGVGYITWECLSRRFASGPDAISHATIEADWHYQDEYCEWRRQDATCRFTTSMEEADAFRLHTENTNSLGAARGVVFDCLADAQKLLAASRGADAGYGCGDANCNPRRNSDVAICDQVRRLAKDAARVSFAPLDFDLGTTATFTAKPAVKLGPYEAALPGGCAYDGGDLRHVTCQVPDGTPAELTCGDLFGSTLHAGVSLELKPVAPAPAP